MIRKASRTALLAWALAALPACGAQTSAVPAAQPAAAPAPPSLPRSLTFRWPDTGSMRVQERVAKKDMRALLEYTVAWRREGLGFQVRLEGFRFLEVDGEPIDTDEKREMFAAVLAMIGAIPVLAVDGQGRLVDLLGMEEMVDRVTRILPSKTPAEQAKIAAWMKSPERMEQLKQTSGAFWYLWVGAWTGVDLPSDGTIRTTSSLPMGQRKVEAPTVITAKLAPQGRVQLTRTTVLDGPEVKAAFEEDMAHMVNDLTPGQSPPKGLIGGLRKTFDLALETDPDTLLPVKASSRQTTEMVIQGERRTMQESHEYAFFRP